MSNTDPLLSQQRKMIAMWESNVVDGTLVRTICRCCGKLGYHKTPRDYCGADCKLWVGHGRTQISKKAIDALLKREARLDRSKYHNSANKSDYADRGMRIQAEALKLAGRELDPGTPFPDELRVHPAPKKPKPQPQEAPQEAHSAPPPQTAAIPRGDVPYEPPKPYHELPIVSTDPRQKLRGELPGDGFETRVCAHPGCNARFRVLQYGMGRKRKYCPEHSKASKRAGREPTGFKAGDMIECAYPKCGKAFPIKKGNQKYCCHEHRALHVSEMRKAETAAKRAAREGLPAEQLSQLAKRIAELESRIVDQDAQIRELRQQRDEAMQRLEEFQVSEKRRHQEDYSKRRELARKDIASRYEVTFRGEFEAADLALKKFQRTAEDLEKLEKEYTAVRNDMHNKTARVIRSLREFIQDDVVHDVMAMGPERNGGVHHKLGNPTQALDRVIDVLEKAKADAEVEVIITSK